MIGDRAPGPDSFGIGLALILVVMGLAFARLASGSSGVAIAWWVPAVVLLVVGVGGLILELTRGYDE